MPSSSYTRLTFLTDWQQELQDPTGRHFTATIGYDLLNQAMGDWCESTKSRLVNTAIDIVANQSVYSLTSLSPRIIEVNRASCPTSSGATDDRLLELLTIEEADECYPNWRSDPASWPFAIIRSVQGPQSLRLYPTPASSQEATVRAGTYFASQATGMLVSIEGMTSAQATAAVGNVVSVEYLVGSLQLYYVAHSTDITSDATTVETACAISPDRQDALLWYACARACEIAVPIALREKAAGYWEKYNAEVHAARTFQQAGFQGRKPRKVPWRNA